MIEGFVHVWHTAVFWAAVGGWVIVAYDHSDKAWALTKWFYNLARPFFPGGQQPPQP